MVKRLVVAIALALAIGGACTLIDDDPPTNTCSQDSDCFRAQGEHCDPAKHVCVPGDAGVDAP
ncbi:MAG: hypothetical protein ACM31C_27245 [Acidobacteriota bacterium]